jgi:hypothetical protein
MPCDVMGQRRVGVAREKRHRLGVHVSQPLEFIGELRIITERPQAEASF